MADDITNGMLLEHIHAMKIDLQKEMQSTKTELRTEMQVMKSDLQDLRTEMRQGFAEARQHRQALQEDLEASMRMLSKHDSTIARLSKNGTR